MTSPTGKPASDARSRTPSAGFTLIELILVMAILLVVMGVGYPSLKNFFRGRTLDSEARRFLSLTRYAQSRAVTEGVPMVLWIDAQERVYGLQAQTGYVDFDRKAVEYDLDKDLEISVSLPPAGTTLSPRKQSAAQNANLPAVRFSPDGYLEATSPEGIEFRSGEDSSQSLWLTQTPSRLQYEINANPPPTLRR